MNAIDTYRTIYFLGIGGIGMSALARWFAKKGLHVSGYDRTRTTLTEQLSSEGIEIHYNDDVENIPSQVIEDNEHTLVVFTPAIPKDHKEHDFLKAEGYTILKRSEVLGLITKNYKTVAVAGTHGKTTTSSMLAHILFSAGKNMVAFLGGISANYESNLVMQGEISNDTIVVAEADEFDRSFLRLFPETAIVTSADPDHLDIYGDHSNMIQSFKDFIGQIHKNGSLIIHESIAEELASEATSVSKYIYSMSRGQFFAGNITAHSGFFEFDLMGFGGTVERIRLGIPGFHNVENALAATLAAAQCGVTISQVKAALKSFRGVKRRFEFIYQNDAVTFIDDYAHHPTEIDSFLRSVKSMYPRKKLTVVFQPHLFTRTRDFAAGFSQSLSLADELFLMDIYPARELPIEGVSSDMLMDKIHAPVKIRCTKNDLMDKLSNHEVEVLATVGAGDIDTFVQPIKNLLKCRYEA